MMVAVLISSSRALGMDEHADVDKLSTAKGAIKIYCEVADRS